MVATTVHPICDVRILYREACSLAKAGYDVEVIGPPPEPSERITGVKLTLIPRERMRFRRLVLSGSRLALLLVQRRASICHLHDPELLWVAPLLRLSGCKVLYDAHEDLPRQIRDKDWSASKATSAPARVALELRPARNVSLGERRHRCHRRRS